MLENYFEVPNSHYIGKRVIGLHGSDAHMEEGVIIGVLPKEYIVKWDNGTTDTRYKIGIQAVDRTF